MADPIHFIVEKPEEYFRTVVESSFNGIAVMDEKGNFEYVNESFLKMVGWQREELIGNSFLKIIPGDMQELALKLCNEVQEGVNNNLEIKIKTRNGELKYLNSFHKLTKINGQLKTVGITEDITERKILEQKLAESEARYRDLFDNALDAIYVHDVEGYFTEVNNAALEVLGCTKEDIIGSHVSKWLRPECVNLTLETMDKQIKGLTVDQPMIREIIRKDGKPIYVEIKSREVKDGDRVIGFHGIARDITEKIKMQRELKEYQEKLEKSYEQLKESEVRYRNFFDNASDSIYCYDSGGYFLDVNKTALELLGCTKEELIGTHISEWITPQSLKTTQEDLKKRVGGEPGKEIMVLDVVDKKRGHHCMEIRRRITRQGDKIVVHGIGRDITERIKLEKELKESETRYRELFENANDAIFISDAEGYIITANNATARLYGYNKKEEVIGIHFTDCLTPECIQDALNNKRKYLSGEPVEQPVIREFINKNGEHRYAEIKSRVIKDGDRVTGLHCIARDITDKIKMQRELKESEAKYRELFENAQDAMYVLDTEGNILNMNQTGLRILGCTKEEVIGSNISKWLTQESLKIALERRKKYLSGEKMNQTDTLEIVCKGGEHRWVEIKTRDIKNDGRRTEIHGIARDITEKMRLKQELMKSNKHKKLLCYLIEGTRGGKTRALILKHLADRSFNAHQLAKAMDMDYKTIRHHLGVLIKNGIITKSSEGYTDLYFLSKNIESDLNELMAS